MDIASRIDSLAAFINQESPSCIRQCHRDIDCLGSTGSIQLLSSPSSAFERVVSTPRRISNELH